MRRRRILIVRTDRMGDVVLATPLIRALRRTYPNAYLAVLVRPYGRDLLLNNPHLDTVLVDDELGAHAGRRGLARLALDLRRQHFDTALLLWPTPRAAWALFWAGIPRRIGVGRKLYEALTLMQSVSRNKYVPLRHEADYCLDLGRRIGVRTGNLAEALAPELFVTDAERAAARARLQAAGAQPGDFLLGVHATSGGSAPNWAPERYVQLATRVLETQPAGVRVVLTGEEVSPAYPASPRIIDTRGRRPLRDLLADLSQLGALVSASTGPMHAAAALRIPTISLFCPLPACSPELWGPQGNESRILVPPDGACPGRCPRDPKTCRFEEISVESALGVIVDTIAALQKGNLGRAVLRAV
jgi:heptosyltransferase-2